MNFYIDNYRCPVHTRRIDNDQYKEPSCLGYNWH